MQDILLKQRVFEFDWGENEEKKLIHLEIPTVDKNTCRVSGDWGPMYEFSLEETSPVYLEYRDFLSDDREKFKLTQQNLIIESPMLSATREKYPLYYLIDHKEKNLRFKLYLNKKLTFSKVEIYKLSDRSCLFSKDI